MSTMSPTAAMGTAGAFGLGALVFLVFGVSASTAIDANSTDVVAPIVARFVYPLAGLFVAYAITFFLRRSPDAPFRPKDIARPIIAGLAVAASMLSALSPWWALAGVIAVALATWSSLAGGFWDREIGNGRTT